MVACQARVGREREEQPVAHLDRRASLVRVACSDVVHAGEQMYPSAWPLRR